MARRSLRWCVRPARRGVLALVVAAGLAACRAPERAPEPRGSVAAAKLDQPAPASAPAPGKPELTPFDHHYGIYLNGAKVGWMRSRLVAGDTYRFSTELHATVGGMGQVSKVELREERAYRPSGALESISFEQTAATGAVRVRGRRDEGDRFSFTVSAGGAQRAQSAEVKETLDDALAQTRLAMAGEVGKSATATRFDPSIMRVVSMEHRVLAKETRMIAGVATEVLRMESRYPELDIVETGWLDRQGNVLESRIGGFFVARLEPPEEAKRLDYQQDLLVSAVVAVPRPIDEPEKLRALRLRFTGFGELTPPASPRQKVTVSGEEVALELGVEAPPQMPWPLDEALKQRHAAFLEATPFIQSDHERVIAAARRAVGDAKDLFTATSRLSSFVYEHVRDEYVPAYSNALEALDTGRGDCTEHSVLFVALARALGIPARVAVGIAYWPPGRGFGWHAWAEVAAGDGWYTVDPTWDQPIADATHIKLAEGGPAEQARIVMLLGRLKIVRMDW